MIDYKNFILKENQYTFEEVCKQLTKRESPLINADTISLLNCMGKSINVMKFCSDKEITNPYLTKAYISTTDKKVVCQSAKRVIIKYKCSKEDFTKFCKDKSIGCFLMKEKMAYRLTTSHSSIDENILTCYFGIKESDKI